MKKNLFQTCQFALLTALLVLSGCMEDHLLQKSTSTNAQNLEELVAPSTFEWKTSQTVTVDITALKTVVPVQSTLSVNCPSNGVLYKGLHLMSENKTLMVEVPTTDKCLTLKFGSVVLTSPIVDNKVSFSFIPVLN